jgi:hypothetical protein
MFMEFVSFYPNETSETNASYMKQSYVSGRYTEMVILSEIRNLRIRNMAKMKLKLPQIISTNYDYFSTVLADDIHLQQSSILNLITDT